MWGFLTVPIRWSDLWLVAGCALICQTRYRDKKSPCLRRAWTEINRRFCVDQYPVCRSTRCKSASPDSPRRIFSAITFEELVGRVAEAICGVTVILGCCQNTCSTGRGSISKTSSVACPRWSASRQANSAASSMSGPKE